MSESIHVHPAHGQVAFLQLPSDDVSRSAEFYAALAGWETSVEWASFEAPGLIGQWTAERSAAASQGPVPWIAVDDLWKALQVVAGHGGTVRVPPLLDQDERWLAEVDDPAGNRIGLIAPVRPPRPQPMIAVADVEASSRWYQELLGLASDHGGPEYERLLAGGELVLQLHQREVGHHHGAVADPGPVGNGALIWFGEVSDFDAVVERAVALGAEQLRPPHRNPPEEDSNGPSHREVWLRDPDGFTVVVASPDGEAWR